MKKIIFICLTFILLSIPAISLAVTFSGDACITQNGESVLMAGKSVTINWNYSGQKGIFSVYINGERVYSSDTTSGSTTIYIGERDIGELDCQIMTWNNKGVIITREFVTKKIVAPYIYVLYVSHPSPYYTFRLTEGDTMTIPVVILPENADKRLKYESSDEDIIKVDQTGLVTAIGPGKATVNISALDGSGKKAKAYFHIKKVTDTDWNTPTPTPKITATPKPTATPMPTSQPTTDPSENYYIGTWKTYKWYKDHLLYDIEDEGWSNFILKINKDYTFSTERLSMTAYGVDCNDWTWSIENGNFIVNIGTHHINNFIYIESPGYLVLNVDNSGVYLLFSHNGMQIETAEPTVDPSLTPPFATMGDVNDDGSVDGRDLLRLARYMAGDGVSINVAAADVNGDGNVDGRDVLRLAKQLAGG